jgi:predicted dehydrogenase
MTDNILTVGQIGCGAFAESQDLPNFAKNPHTAVKWCCDLSPERARAMAAKFAVPNATGTFMDVVDDPEVDLIKIATSHEIHLPIIAAAAAKGKHVFCEKPMAMEEAEALKIIAIVQKSRIKFCVDLNRRMAPSLQALRQHWQEHVKHPCHQPWRYVEVDREPLPEERQTQFLVRVQDESLSYRLVHLDPLRGGGQIIGESVHWLDLACWFFAPQVPVQIAAWGSTRLSHGIHLTFTSGDNATLLFNCGGTFDYPKELYEVTHDGALLRNLCFVENEYYGIPGLDRETFPLQHDPLPDVGTEGGFAGYMKKHQARVGALNGNAKSGHEALSFDKGHQGMLDRFVDSIRNGTPSPCGALSGYLATYLAKQAIKSIELRQALPIPVDKVLPCIA